MKNKKIIILIIVLVILTFFIIISYYIVKGSFSNQNNDTDFFVEMEKLSNSKYIFDYSNIEIIRLENSDIKVRNTEKMYIKKNILNIYRGGTYLLEGYGSNIQIVIDISYRDEVNLILNNVKINSNLISPIYIKNAEKVNVFLPDNTTNVFSINSNKKNLEKNHVNSVIYSKEKIFFTGEGKLYINSNFGYGISSEKDVIFIGGKYNITVEDRGIFSKENIGILDGDLNISSKDDTIHSDKNIYINGGRMNLKTRDDAIRANKTCIINYGDISVHECFEGIEALEIEMNGGNIRIISNDDGLNARDYRKIIFDEENYKEFEKDASLSIRGGNLDIKSGGDSLDSNGNIYLYSGKVNLSNFAHVVGDGVDANGDLYIYGGEIYISGPFDGGGIALDSWGNNVIYGGTCVATTMGVNRSFVKPSTQIAVTVNLRKIKNGNDIVRLIDEHGNTIVSYKPVNNYRYIIISSPEIEVGKQYILQYGEEYTNIVIEEEDTNIRL